MALIHLFFVFFQVGLFTIGGGLVAITILQRFVEMYQWVSQELFIDMIAVSQSTPGPIGVNMATFVGFAQYGVIGSVIATLGMVVPSILVIYVISKFLNAYQHNVYIKHGMSSIRPVVIGLITAAALIIGEVSLISYITINNLGIEKEQIVPQWDKMLFLLLIGFAIFKFQKHPIIYLAIGAVVGVLFF
jgi:chromate transporter